MLTYFLSVAIVLFMLLGWVAVQQVYRRFAENHPELGPYRDDRGGGCGSCGCGGGGDVCHSDIDRQ